MSNDSKQPDLPPISVVNFARPVTIGTQMHEQWGPNIAKQLQGESTVREDQRGNIWITFKSPMAEFLTMVPVGNVVDVVRVTKKEQKR